MGKRAAAIYQIETMDRIEAKLDYIQKQLERFEAPEIKIEPAQPGFDPAELIAKIDALLERFGFVEDEGEPEKALEPKAPKKAKK